jgi:hypothetical protein
MIGCEQFDSIRDAIFISGRGPVVQEDNSGCCVTARQVKGAALDVWNPGTDFLSPLWGNGECAIVSHNMDQTATFIMHRGPAEFFVEEHWFYSWRTPLLNRSGCSYTATRLITTHIINNW